MGWSQLTIFAKSTEKMINEFKTIQLFSDNIYQYKKLLLVNLTNDVNNPLDLKQKLLEKCQTLDFKALTSDVQPFLFNPNDKRVEMFLRYLETVDFSLLQN